MAHLAGDPTTQAMPIMKFHILAVLIRSSNYSNVDSSGKDIKEKKEKRENYMIQSGAQSAHARIQIMLQPESKA